MTSGRLVVLFALALLLVVFISWSSQRLKFKSGDYVMPIHETSPQTIVQIVGVTRDSYKVFTHFFSGGKLLVAETYDSRPRALIDATYVKVPAPAVDGAFSPDRFLSSPDAVKRSPAPK